MIHIFITRIFQIFIKHSLCHVFYPHSAPPTFTNKADCQQNRTLSKLICQCYGTGVPSPEVFWTKGGSSVIIGRGNIYEKSLTESDVNGNYVCHLKNALQEVTSTYGFSDGSMYNYIASL